ncbi:MAG TPA: tetratricopeptide repeat protein [Candidatus Sulfotelmatobacter sp.]|jgi:tetratricopeptide (TPR) repeat protein|nr:tetratricopeptide repeat protein [Candidatus Sulfotelmatobacter sp.]
MTSRKRTTVIASTCLVVSMTACVLLLRHIDRLRPQATIDDALYVSSPSIVRRASLGFNGLMACIYWTRTVQYFGHRHYDRAHTYGQLAPLLEITTTLDPQLFPAYQFGASFLAPAPPNGAGEPARAIELMQYGIEHNPDNWQLYYNLGFVYYTELKDYKKAGDIFERGSKIPGAHPFMKILAAQMAEHAGDYLTARLLWSATLEGSHETNIRQNALEHLRAISVDEDISNLQAAVTRFGERTGRLPASMAELASAENLGGIPADPDGNPFKLSPEGRVLLEKPDDFPFVTKGLPAGYKPVGRPKFHVKG